MADPVLTTDTNRLQHYIELLTAELHESQRRQQALIAALDKARHELMALDGNIVFYDGERLIRG
jgi:hypothetical protein